MTSDEIRETFLSYFEQRGHRRLPSASLVPAAFDPSVLLTTAGMHPLKPYFMGLEQPPHHRLTSCQKCFRTPDIEKVGKTTRHLTFFEMLGNFSLGDYFKQGAIEMAWELSLEGWGFKPEDIWVTVFEGDAELGIGPDEEAIDAWESVGVPRERIVLLGRKENFWQAGPTGPCGPCSELYLDRGPEWGGPDDRPGDENERFLEYWNLVFMQFNQDPAGTLTPLPAQNIDTGLGLNRMALIQQGVDTVFDTDQFRPLIDLGIELVRAARRPRAADPRRPLARHDVPHRRRRRAVQRGPRLRAAPAHAPRDPAGPPHRHRAGLPAAVRRRRHRDDGQGVPRARTRERDTILKWVRAEEEGFGRTLDTGMKMLDELLAAGEVARRGRVPPARHVRLPDRPHAARSPPSAASQVDVAGFERADGGPARALAPRARAAARRSAPTQELVRALASDATQFTGYETSRSARRSPASPSRAAGRS